MKAKCYYCGKELNERTIKRHMKTCSLMQEVVESGLNDSELREQLIVSIKPKEDKSKYCIYLSVASGLSLRDFEGFLRDVWIKDDNQSGFFKGQGHIYNEGDMESLPVWRLFDSVGSKCTYECHYAEKIEIELVDCKKVSSYNYSEIEIIARNEELGSPYDKEEDSEYDKQVDKDYGLGNNLIFQLCDTSNESEEVEGASSVASMSEDADDEYFDILSDEVKAMMDNMAKVIESLMVKDFSLNIEKIVSSLKKDDIYFMARRLGIAKVSSLSKEKLVDKFLGEYEEKIKEKLQCFDSRRLDFLKKFAEEGTKSLDDIKIGIEELLYFRNLGMLFFTVKNHDEVIVYVPDVIKEILSDTSDFMFRNKLKNNTYICELFMGMISAYGAIKVTDIEEKISAYSVAPGTDVAEIIAEAENYYPYEVVDGYYMSSQAYEPNSVIKSIEGCTDRKDAVIPEAELLQLGREGGVLNTKYGAAFYDAFVEMFDIDAQTLNELAESIFRDVQEVDSEEVIEMALSMVSECDAEVISYVESLLRDYVNSIRLWKFRGASMKEVTGKGITIVKDAEVGRNEPCPCGSGKKYKKCCGKNGKVINLF